MAWKISNALKKQAVELEYFSNGKGDLIIREHGWRWASVTVLDKPDLSIIDEEDHIDALTEFGDVIDQDTTDGCWEEWDFPENMSEEDKEKVIEIWEEEWSLESLGWEQTEFELRLWGPLDVEEVETPAYAILPEKTDIPKQENWTKVMEKEALEKGYVKMDDIWISPEVQKDWENKS
jgi:hypothetical protein